MEIPAVLFLLLVCSLKPSIQSGQSCVDQKDCLSGFCFENRCLSKTKIYNQVGNSRIFIKEKVSACGKNCYSPSDCGDCKYCYENQCCNCKNNKSCKCNSNSTHDRGTVQCGRTCNTWIDCDQRQCGTCSHNVCVNWPVVLKLDNHQLNRESTSNIAGTEVYFRFQWAITMPVKFMTITLTKASPDGFLTLLVANTGDIATTEHHQYTNDSDSDIKSITIVQPKYINGNFGWGFTVVNGKAVNTQYIIQLDVYYEDPQCPENCNNHGKCVYEDSKPVCVCDDDWGGVACAYTKYNLSADHPVSVTIKQHEYIYFAIITKSPPFNNMTMVVQTFTKDVNAIAPAIYAANGFYPTSDNFQRQDTRTDLRKSLTILDPVVGDWYFGVLGRDSAPLILTVQVNMDDVCFSKCSSHGLCTPPMNGYVSCKCGDGFKGEYCEEYTDLMKNGTKYSGYVSEGFWNYWHFNITVSPTDEMFLVLNISAVQDGLQPPDLYTQINGKPTNDSNFCHMPSQTQYKVENMYTCVVKDKSMLGKGNSWYIGAVGTSMGMGNYTVSATLYLTGTPPSNVNAVSEESGKL